MMPRLTFAGGTARTAVAPIQATAHASTTAVRRDRRMLRFARRSIEDQPVAVHGLDVRRTRLELARVQRADASAETRAVEAAELDPVSGAHGTVAPNDADGEQTAPAA